MHISLTPQLEDLIQKKVASGVYNNASEVVREALRLFEEYDRARTIRLEELRREVLKGLESGDPRPLDIDEIERKGRARLAQRTKGRKS